MSLPTLPTTPQALPLRIIFMGTPELAAHILDRLVRSAGSIWQVVAVVTRGDRPRGRGLKMEESQVAEVAQQYQLPTLKPERIKTAEFAQQLTSFAPDVIVVAAYGRILPGSVLEAPRLLPINVHTSLLPLHRGASPIEAAILAGDATTGVTIMRITERMDAGAILLQRQCEVTADETRTTLGNKLSELGAQALIEALGQLARGELRETGQDESLATYTTLIKREHGLIDWNSPAEVIERMTRAYEPWPVAHTIFKGQELRLYRAMVESSAHLPADTYPPGSVINLEREPIIRCGARALRLLEVQLPGRKRISGADFVRGQRLEVGVRLGS